MFVGCPRERILGVAFLFQIDGMLNSFNAGGDDCRVFRCPLQTCQNDPSFFKSTFVEQPSRRFGEEHERDHDDERKHRLKSNGESVRWN